MQNLVEWELARFARRAHGDRIPASLGLVLDLIGDILGEFLVIRVFGDHVQFVKPVFLAKPFNCLEGYVAVGAAVELGRYLGRVVGQARDAQLALFLVGRLDQNHIAHLSFDQRQRGAFNQDLALRRRPRPALGPNLVDQNVVVVLDGEDGEIGPFAWAGPNPHIDGPPGVRVPHLTHSAH